MKPVLPELPADIWLRVYLMLEDSSTLHKVVPRVCHTWAKEMDGLLSMWASANVKEGIEVFPFPAPRAIAVHMQTEGIMNIDPKYIAQPKRINCSSK